MINNIQILGIRCLNFYRKAAETAKKRKEIGATTKRTFLFLDTRDETSKRLLIVTIIGLYSFFDDKMKRREGSYESLAISLRASRGKNRSALY